MLPSGCMSASIGNNQSLAPDEVVVTVSAAGICAGDLHIYSGKSPYQRRFPSVAFHGGDGQHQNDQDALSNLLQSTG